MRCAVVAPTFPAPTTVIFGTIRRCEVSVDCRRQRAGRCAGDQDRELNSPGGTLPMRWTIAAVLIVAGCAKSDSTPDRSTSDSAFASLQARGERAMGVDQYSSTHLFIPLPN